VNKSDSITLIWHIRLHCIKDITAAADSVLIVPIALNNLPKDDISRMLLAY
jgi:hypothetical protein